MTLSDIFNQSLKKVKSNSPAILTGLGVAGVITTAYLTARASFKAKEKLDNDTPGTIKDGVVEKRTDFPLKYQVKMVWKFYIPPAVSGAATIAAIIGASKTSGRRTAAAVTAYSLTQKAFDEYKEHVIDQIGKNKEQKIRDEIAQKHVTENPPKDNQVVILGNGQVLCCELWTGRYFRSDHETLRKAENEINAMIVNTYYVTLEELYDILGLQNTTDSSNMGWNSDRLLQFQYSTVLSPDGEPCLAFEYNYLRPNSFSKLA